MRADAAQRWAWEQYAPVMALEAKLPTPLRRALTRGVGLAAALALLGASAALFIGVDPALVLAMGGVGASAAGVWLLLISLEWFRRWFYYREFAVGAPPLLTFESASVLYFTPPHDAAAGLLRSYFGAVVLRRLGVEAEAMEAFLQDARRATVPLASLTLPPERPVRVGTYAKAVYAADASLQRWLARLGIREGDVEEAAMLIDALWEERKRAQRWWAWENLGRLRPIGRSLSYGQRYELVRYSLPIAALAGAEGAAAFRHRPELRALEEALLAEPARTVFLVGNAGSGTEALVAAFDQALREGAVLPELLDKEVVVLNWEPLVGEAKAGGVPLEVRCEAVFAEALQAGNIILVIPNFAGFLEAAQALGVDLVDVIEPFVLHPELTVVLLVDQARFATVVRPDGRLLRGAGVVQMREEDYQSLLWLIWHAVLPLERRTRIFFLIPAVRALADVALRYLPPGQRAERAVALAERILSEAKARGVAAVDEGLVRSVASSVFSVPLAEPDQEERAKLLQLEELLAREVVGQEEALRAIAQALRRARAGVRSRERPIGSFLFLGPTGVGKTQTAKALAKVFFGDERRMVRFDMTEYRGTTALTRLIGDAAGRIPGRLASALRDQPFAVYLLDEFEKTEPEVHDLFLQIFDEGRFTDGRGEVVFARDAIFIATSNAGSDIIWRYFTEGEDLAKHREAVLDAIVARGLFKPELLNRFDAVVFFHPLERAEVAEIARRMVEAFVERMQKERGVKVEVSGETMEEILRRGYDPKFGARPMRRAVQEVLEQRVADALLAQEAERGGRIVV